MVGVGVGVSLSMYIYHELRTLCTYMHEGK
jgi:hypothetical protein